jgi:FtsZ-binding cell division protein ZapB
MMENDTFVYQAWVNDLQRDVDQLREDKRELIKKVAALQTEIENLFYKINNLIHQRGDE